MTTPSSMNALLEHLQERFEDARRDVTDSATTAMNSYGAGYDQGYFDALGELIEHITGDRPSAALQEAGR